MESLLSKLCRERDLTFTLHETCDQDDNDQVFCLACGDLVIGCPTYILETDDRVRFHKSCAELTGKIQHPLHTQHALKVHRRLRYGFICDGCRHVSFGLSYRCKECKFKLDLQCASKNEGQALKEIVEKDTIYHPHTLQHVYFYSPMRTYLSDDELSLFLVCCCCVKSCLDGRDPTYTCNVCFESKKPFFIHKSCLDRVPRQVQSSFHPERPLFIRPVDGKSHCLWCDNWTRGLALTCEKCHIEFHVSCSSGTTRGLRLKRHQHDMHYVISKSPNLNPCPICEAQCEGAFYRCVECDVNMHMECIPLREIVEHESHEYHPLKLTDSVVTHRDDDEYRCDICEEEGNIKHHSYYCKECNFIAHIECVHSEHQDGTSPKISCLDPKLKAKNVPRPINIEDLVTEEGPDDALMEANEATENFSWMTRHQRYRSRGKQRYLARGKDKADNEDEEPDSENENIEEVTACAEEENDGAPMEANEATENFSRMTRHQRYRSRGKQRYLARGKDKAENEDEEPDLENENKEETEDAEVENDDALMESNDAMRNISRMTLHQRYLARGKDKAENENEYPDVENDEAEEETEDAEVENEDTDLENDEAEEETEDTDLENDEAEEETDDASESLFTVDSDTLSYRSSNSGHQQYDKSDMDNSIINIKGRIEKLVSQLGAIANLDKRIENVKADMVELVFQLDDHRKKFVYQK